MITITALQKVISGKEIELETVMKFLTEQVKKNEPKCTIFEFVHSKDQANTYLVIEQYLDEAALAEHMNQPYLQETLPKIMACLEHSPELASYENNIKISQIVPTYFHVGLIVQDIQKAMKDYSETLGLTWTDPFTFEIPNLEDPNPHHHDLLAVFSRQGPPYYELLQASGDGIFSTKYSNSIHYLGLYEPDIPGRIAVLQAVNYPIDAIFRDSAGNPFGLITGPGTLGIRLEYVDLNTRPAIEEWVKTGVFPGKVAE